MTQLIITDIRKSGCDTRFDLITAIFLHRDCNEAGGRMHLDEKSVLVLESATAQKEMPSIGVRSGDQYIRLRAKPDHGLMLGDEIQFGKN